LEDKNPRFALDDTPVGCYSLPLVSPEMPGDIPFVDQVWAGSRIIMYAIICDGGRQFKVEQGQLLDIDYRETAMTGDQVEFDRVLAIGGESGLKLGQPTVAGAKVSASVVGLEQGEKIYIQKFRRRKNYEVRTGHRQKYTRVKIESIQG
jgi:large subunit ribosomal protein L21